MDRLDEIAKQLISECYEQGLPVVIGIANPATGRTIRTASGDIYSLATIMSMLAIELSEKSGTELDNMLDSITAVAKDLAKDMKSTKKSKKVKKSK